MVTIAGKKCGALTCLGGRGQGMCRMHGSYLPKRGRGGDFLSEESSVVGWGKHGEHRGWKKKGGRAGPAREVSRGCATWGLAGP